MSSLLASLVLAAAIALSIPAAGAAPPHLVSFHDPVYGFTLSYPATWTLVPERDGSHITLVNQATLSEISPIVTTHTGTVNAVLARLVPADAINVHPRTVAGEQAVEYLVPFTPGSLGDRAHGFRPRLQNHVVAVAAPNIAGSITVYTLLLTQGTDAAGHVSPAVSADAAALLDGHNATLYHQSVQSQLQFFASYQVIHLHALSGFETSSVRNGTGWNSQTDGWGQASYWAYTTTASSATAWATLSDSGNTVRCAVAVYVPFGGGTANITYSVRMANGTWAYRTVNQNNFEGWALLFKWGELGSPPVLISVGNNNGTSTQQLGVGDMAFLC